ncbi:alpha/beta hydrolase [Rubripirellula amarantea]|uniref:alpha/beta hydrolase n=1 Tax=Rubripirellula amarantea TaxID=2527999 RepID=UPI0013EF4315|nr:alpha/beta fold hydrolase [Rubripirellula amarantea]
MSSVTVRVLESIVPIRRFRRYLLDRLVLRPSRHFLDSGDQRPITFKTSAGRTQAFERCIGDQARTPDVVVVKFPGTAGRAERASSFPLSLVRSFQDSLSGKVITWNPPGYGNSEGKASLTEMVAAASDMLEQVIENELTDETVLWLCGNSLGCNTALHLASDPRTARRVDGLVLRNPPPLVPVIKHVASDYLLGRWIYPVADSVIPQMNAHWTAPQVRAPAVFLKSELDSLVLPELQQMIIDDYGGDFRLVSLDGLDHDGIPTEDHERQIEVALAWLWQQSHVLVAK